MLNEEFPGFSLKHRVLGEMLADFGHYDSEGY